MPEKQPQTYKNHAKLDPVFHFFVAPVALATVVMAVIRAVRHFSFVNSWLAVLAVAFLLAVFRIRIYALKVQDRVIRLEERLRMERVFSEPLRSRIGELSPGQWVALRFAPDAELQDLTERTLANGWKNKEIKLAIKNWRPDDFRV